MNTHAVKVNGEAMAQGVVKALVRDSMWFTFEPLPDDDYEITVKAENKGLLDHIVVMATFADPDAGWLTSPEEIEANRKAGSFVP